MTVQDLIDRLSEIEDKTLPIRLVDVDNEDAENIWAFNMEVNDRGQSGYESGGEVRLLGGE